jgi:four helix bundle protein
MSGMKNDRELDAWKLAMTLVETTYSLTRSLPDSERFNLIFQMQKSATSIPSNIAEGQSRGTAKFGLYFLRVAIGSSAELGTQVELTRRLKYVTPDASRELDEQLVVSVRCCTGCKASICVASDKPAQPLFLSSFFCERLGFLLKHRSCATATTTFIGYRPSVIDHRTPAPLY